MAKNLKSITPIYEDPNGVCLWIMPDGAIFGDDDGRYLSLDGPMNSSIVEGKMKKAAIYWGGDEAILGQPLWINGSRRVSDEEYAAQVERMEGGEIPDIVDELKQGGVKEFQ